MKKIILIAVALIGAAFSMSAQESGFSIKAGVGASTITGDNSSDVLKYAVSFKAGVGYDYALSEYFSLQPSLMIVSKGAAVKNSNLAWITNKLGLTKDDALHGYYFELPVLGCLKYPFSDAVKGYFNFGPTFSVGFAGNYFDDIPDFNRFDLGVQTGIGLEFNNGFIIGADFNYGCLKLRDNFDYNNMGFGATLGYKF